jgi:hypothetical protein
MHGGASLCPNSPDRELVEQGDRVTAQYVNAIMNSSTWGTGNNAIVITFDEGNTNRGCCGSAPGGGHICTAVITNNGPRGLVDDTHYNHYSRLETIESALGLACLRKACDTAQNVQPMAPLFAHP